MQLADIGLILPFLAIAAGCDGDPVYPVSGRVVLADGMPLDGGQIEFRHTERPVSAVGYLGTDGAFELTLHDQNDGTLLGTYRVGIVPPPPPPGIPGRHAEEAPLAAAREKWLRQVPARYQDPNTSGISVTIQRGGNTSLKIALEP